MQIEKLHKNSYNQLTDYYADLSEPMAALRRQVLNAILLGQPCETPIHELGVADDRSRIIPSLGHQCSVLDVGCANGDNLQLMRHLGFHALSGLDIAPEMVSAAIARTELPIHCGNLFDYQGPQVDVVFAQALVHLFPKLELPQVFLHLHALCKQRFYFSTTVHDEAKEGLEPKQQIVRYRSRYTKQELLTAMQTFQEKLNTLESTWRVYYFFLTDCLEKHWINVVFDKSM